MSVRIGVRRAITLAILLATVLVGAAWSAPPSAQRLAIQGVARDAAGMLIPAGDISVRVYADSLGGTPLHDSGTEFEGAIVQGIFDVVVGEASVLSLDPDASAFLEVDVAGTEIIGDAAGGRWRFFPGGGSRARPDLEARLAALEAAVDLSPYARARRNSAWVERPRTPTIATARPAGVALVRSPLDEGPAGVHGLLGAGRVAGQNPTLTIEGHLIVQPVGVRVRAGVVAEFGPYYLYAPRPSPAIRFVRDVPNDQGRSVRVRWRRDLRERAYEPSDPKPLVTGYTLYRRVDPGQSAAAPASGAAAARPSSSAMNMIRLRDGGRPEAGDLLPESGSAESADPGETLALPPGEWDVLGTFPATLDTAYQTVVPTLCDSTNAGICWSVFAVRAITNHVGTFYDSFADSGYSIDNLAPAVPAGFALQPVTGGTSLTWQPSSAPDLGHYRVYRSTDPGFTPGPGSLVHSTIQTSWTDPVTGSYTYRLTAVDLNGNESLPASASITIGVEPMMPAVLSLSMLAPNPFRDHVQLAIEVPEAAGLVEVSVFDVSGRRVRNLARSLLAPGRHAFAWDGRTDAGARLPAGVYVLRLSGAGRVITRRTAMLP